ncbi:MAG TPA: MarR family winged helix-turn-helix transcriptional regulator [Acidimicrobiia bacterium]|nr:MarR family winged helix-turn-helix transcriptional regulator [Acidimicrobiia bacterium]
MSPNKHLEPDKHLENAPLGRLVAMAGHLANERWTRYVSDSYGLSPAGAAVLMALSHDRKMTHRDLANVCYIRPATLTGVVDTLVRSGHVERKADEVDRRTVWVTATRKGSAVGAKVTKRVTGHGRDGSERVIRSLTSVDAHPKNEAIIRRFLTELIVRLSEPELSNKDKEKPET